MPAYLYSRGDLKLSNHFKLHEFRCSDGSDLVVVSSELIERLQQLRNSLSKPIIINSAFRSIAHNKKVGGSKQSYHMTGQAADIRVTGLSVPTLAQAAQKAGFRGVIQYPNQGFVHVDVRAQPYYAVNK